jgi:type IV secretion system protein VirB5
VRRLLFIGACALAPLASARADVPVIDGASLVQLLKEVQQAAQEIQLLQQQLQQVMTIYNAISHVTDLGTAVSALDMLGIQNPLPVNPYSVQSLLSGRSGITGMSGSIGTLFNSNWTANHVYTPTGSSFEANLIQRGATSIAGIQGVSGQLYQSMAQRLPLMQQLQDRLAATKDPKDVMDLQARLAAEQSYIQAQGVQAQTLAMMQVAAYQDQQQERDEQRQANIDAVLAEDPDR